MKILAIANASGGRGKTAITKKLASLLANRHQRSVVIVDLDHQLGGNISSHFLVQSQIVASKETIPEALRDPHITPHSVSPRIDLFVGNETLRQADTWFRPQLNPNAVLRTFFKTWQQAQQYDYCLMDCSPGLGSVLTRNALVAADDILVPIWVHRSSTDFDVAEMNGAMTLDEAYKLRRELALPVDNVGFSLPKPLDELSDEDWHALTQYVITRLAL
ncbi:MAG TPA: AAA family ATPase [Ktedonobacteraceae bacterium]|nr:AAA family ATPase [Ktedonobacteraceae bacterium]